MENFDWSSIDWETFELLALDYAQSTYPEFEWVKSPSRGYNQDNHDIAAKVTGKNIKEAGFSWEEIVLNNEYEIWGEVKHSNHPAKRIGKQQLDPTIVSALIAGNVILLLFITNKRFTSNYKIRVEKALLGSTKFFDYTDIDDIEIWLSNYPYYAQKYFPGKHGILKKEKKEIEIKDACFFDLKDLRNKYYSIVKELKLNQEYVFFLSIKSVAAKSLSLINTKSLPFLIEPLPGFDYKNELISLSKGTTNLFLLIRPARLAEIKQVNLQLVDSDLKRYEAACDIKASINYFRDLTIVFTQQVLLADKLLQLIKNETQGQIMFLLYAQGGIGKSTILEKLYLDLGPHKQILNIDFTDNSNINAKKVCELILFLNYGDSYSELSPDIVEQMESNSRYINQYLLKGIAQIAISVDGANNKLESLLSNYYDSILINPKRLNVTKIVLCDDLHKLDSSAVNAFERILRQIARDNLNVFTVMTARENEFLLSGFKDFIEKEGPVPYRLHSPTSTDILSTLQLYFKDIGNLITLSSLEGHQLKTIVWQEILKDLDREINEYPKDNFGFSRYFHIQIAEVSQRREAFLRRIFVPFKKMEYLIDAVYGYKSGLQIDKIIHAFSKLNYLVSTVQRDINILLEENLIRREGGFLFPWHDIYHQEYYKYKSSEKIFNAELATFLEYYIEGDTVNSSLAVALLLRCDSPEKSKYVELAKSMCHQYFIATNFGAALELAETLVNYYKTNHSKWLLEYESLSANFKYAVCLNHCGSLLASKRVFTEVYNAGINLPGDPDSKTLAFEAKSELFNIKYWLLETKTIEDLDDFIAILENNYAEYKQLEHFSNAYLITINRRMVFYLLLDEYEKAAWFFNRSIEESVKLGRKEYQGFALMDYAKGQYHLDIDKSLHYLQTAKDIFAETNQQRRLLDCECEINFLEQIKYGDRMTSLERSSIKLKENGLTNLYIKSLLKIAACLLVSGRSEEKEIRFLIEKANHGSRQFSSPRMELICANLYTAIKGRFNNGLDINIEVARHKACCRNIGNSYKKIASQNETTTNLSTISWSIATMLTESSGIGIDPRIW